MTTMATPKQHVPDAPGAGLQPQIRVSRHKRVKSGIFHLVALALTGVVLYPALWMVASAFKPNAEIGGANTSLWSKTSASITSSRRWTGSAGCPPCSSSPTPWSWPSAPWSAPSSPLSVSAYAFARIKFPGRSIFFGMMIATLLLPFHVVIIPQYIVFNQLGLVDTYVPLLIGKFLAADAFFVFLMVQFMRNLPAELDEAARIDGAGHVRIFRSIMLPLMKPALISTSIFSFIWSWNDFLGPLLYLNTPEKYPLPLALRLFVDQTQSSDYGAMIAMSVLALLPVLIFFLVFQRYIVEGVSTQGLKG